MATDKIRVEGFERVDIQDFQAAVKGTLEEQERQLFSQFFTDPSKTQLWVLDGFEMSNPSAKLVTVTRGRAILGSRDGGTVLPGMLCTEGDMSITVDLNTYADAIYNIYVRFESVPGEYQTRLFWNPDGTGSEFGRSIATKYVAGWNVRIETTSPGAEWLKIGEVYLNQPGHGTIDVIDTRDLYFEGLQQGDSTFKTGWSTDGAGSADDRDADRLAHGVKDLRTFVAATQQCLEDIKGRGLSKWYERSIGGMNIGFDAAPVADRLAVGDANFNLVLDGITPYLYFDATDFIAYDRLNDILAFYIGGAEKVALKANELYPGFNNTLDLGNTSKRYKDLWLAGTIQNVTNINMTGAITNTGDVVVTPVAAGALRASAQTFNLGNATIPWNTAYAHRMELFSHSGGDANTPEVYFENQNGANPARNKWRVHAQSDAIFALENIISGTGYDFLTFTSDGTTTPSSINAKAPFHADAKVIVGNGLSVDTNALLHVGGAGLKVDGLDHASPTAEYVGLFDRDGYHPCIEWDQPSAATNCKTWRVCAQTNAVLAFNVVDSGGNELRFMNFEHDGGTDKAWSVAFSAEQVLFQSNVVSFATAAGKGIASNLVPNTTGRDLGNSSYPWQKAYFAVTGGNGIATALIPVSTGLDLGNSTYYWDDVYANKVWVKDTGGTQGVATFDTEDDLALIDRMTPDGEAIVVRKNGQDRNIITTNPENVPWPMRNDDGKFLDLPSSLMFILGAIKQLHAKVRNLETALARA
jgi:hypothetical protein